MATCDMLVTKVSSLNDHNNENGDSTLSEQFRIIARRMSRALLRHPQLPLLHTNARAMYMALHEFFAQWSAREKRALSISITEEQVVSLLHYGEAMIRKAEASGSAPDPARGAAGLVAAAPFVPIESLARELPAGVALVPTAELVELARVLDDAQGLCTPFGTINLVHLVALGATLLSAPDMKTLLLFVAGSLQHRILCAAIFYEWSLIDRTNTDSLRELAQRVEQGPCDFGVADLVAVLLESAFERLGSSPLDTAVAELPVDGGGTSCSLRSHTPSLDLAQEKSDSVVPHTLMQDDDIGHCDLVMGSVDMAESDVSGEVDLEFWRQLCS